MYFDLIDRQLRTNKNIRPTQLQEQIAPFLAYHGEYTATVCINNTEVQQVAFRMDDSSNLPFDLSIVVPDNWTKP